MTNAIEGEQLTRIGPGTLMGDLMRQYLAARPESLRTHRRRRSGAPDAARREADCVP